MRRVRITAMCKVEHSELIERYENAIENACDVQEGMSWVSENGERPKGFCQEAWKTVGEFARRLARGEEDFFNGWMKNRRSAMVSCNDGFRPVSFYIEVIE